MNLATRLILGLKHLAYGDKRIARYVLQKELAGYKATIKALRAELESERRVRLFYEFDVSRKKAV